MVTLIALAFLGAAAWAAQTPRHPKAEATAPSRTAEDWRSVGLNDPGQLRSYHLGGALVRIAIDSQDICMAVISSHYGSHSCTTDGRLPMMSDVAAPHSYRLSGMLPVGARKVRVLTSRHRTVRPDRAGRVFSAMFPGAPVKLTWQDAAGRAHSRRFPG